MAIVINGERIPDALVDEEYARLLKSGHGKSASGEIDAASLKLMAACGVVDRVLIRQAAEKDTRPIDPSLVEAAMREQMQRGNCKTGVNEEVMRRLAEQELRLRRTTDELAGEFAPPTAGEVLQFFTAFQAQFNQIETAEAAHIVVHVNEQRGEEEARTIIQSALAALEGGAPFAEIAERFSDCKGSGGDLGSFERGIMVEEFEDAVFGLAPGERTGIFRTPFGFHIAERRRRGHTGSPEPGLAQREIAAYLTAKRKRAAMERGLQKLREAAVIERVEEFATAAPSR